MMFTGGRKRSTGVRTSQKRYGYPHSDKSSRNSCSEVSQLDLINDFQKNNEFVNSKY